MKGDFWGENLDWNLEHFDRENYKLQNCNIFVGRFLWGIHSTWFFVWICLFFLNSLFAFTLGHRPSLDFLNLFDLGTCANIFHPLLRCHSNTVLLIYLLGLCFPFFLVHWSSSCGGTFPTQSHFFSAVLPITPSTLVLLLIWAVSPRHRELGVHKR